MGARVRNGLRTWLAAGLVAVCGCSGEPERLKLLPGDEARKERDAEWRRLQEMQQVTIVSVDGDTETPMSVDAAEIDEQIRFSCMQQIAQQMDSTYHAGKECFTVYTYTRMAICAAHSLLEAATIRAEPVVVHGTSEPEFAEFKIFAQSSAANAALSRRAMTALREGIGNAASMLEDARSTSYPGPNGTGCTQTEAAETMDPDHGASENGPAPEELAGLLVARALKEALLLYREATEVTFDNVLAVADSQLDSSSRTQAAARAVSGEQLSRAEAARLWVGGFPALHDGTDEVPHGFPGFVAGRQQYNALPVGGFCTEPELSAQAQVAVSVLRDAAIDPEALLDEDGTSIAELLGDSGAATGGSVKERLSDYWGDEYFTGDNVAAQFGLESGDFAQARRYLEQEILAFSRSFDSAEPKLKRDGTSSSFSAFGATATAPQPRPAAYYAALARYDVHAMINGASLPDLDDYPSGDEVPPIAYAEMLDWVLRNVSVALEDPGLYDEDLSKGLMELLSLEAQDSERLGRFQLCGPAGSGGSGIFATAHGFGTDDGLIVVKGEDDLSCAVEGQVEGNRNCTWTTSSALVLSNPRTPHAGFGQATTGTGGAYAQDARYYLLRPKTGAPAPLEAPEPGAGLRPRGSYEVLTGLTLPANVPLWPVVGFCVETAIVPEAEQKAAVALAPNEDSCSHSKLTCAGAEFDERLPLEDELSDDSDDIESSWRRYLTLARQAADEADALGEQYILAGLDVDRREEELSIREEQKRQAVDSVLEELQAICGTAIDTGTLFKLLSTVDDLSKAWDGYCEDGACTDGYKCVGSGDEGSCVLLLPKYIRDTAIAKQDPDLQRLADCIDPGVASAFVHLGEDDGDGGKGVCIWRGRGAKVNEICEGPPGVITAGDCDPSVAGNQSCERRDFPCPAVANSEEECFSELGFEGKGFTSTQVEESDLIELVYVNEGLGYFPFSESPTPPSYYCDAIRKNRATPGSDSGGLSSLKLSNVLHPMYVEEAAKRLGFRAMLGSFGAITLDGADWFKTGTAAGGPAPATAWPCGVKPSFSTCINGSDEAGLFCGASAPPGESLCADLNTREAINDRMLRAVVAVKVLAEQFHDPKGVRNLWLPTIDVDGVRNLGARTVNGVETLFGGTPVRAWTTNNEQVLYTAEEEVLDGRSYGAAPYTSVDGHPWAFRFANWGPMKPLDFVDGDGKKLLKGLYRGDINGNETNVFPLSLYLGGTLPTDRQTWPMYASSIDLPFSWGGWTTAWEQLEETCPYVGASQVCPNGFEGPRDGICTIDGGRYNCVRQVNVPDGPLHSVSSFTFSEAEFMDGLELLCEINTDSRGCDLNHPPEVRTVSDLPKAHQFLQCVADDILGRGALTIFSNLPGRAKDALRKESLIGAFPAQGGAMGSAISRIRSGLVGVYEAMPLIAAEVRNLGFDMDELHGLLAQVENQQEISDLQFMSQVADRIAACAAVDISTFGFNNAVQCANSLAQIQFASQINHLAAEGTNTAKGLAMTDFARKFSDRATAMQGHSLALTQAIEQVDQGLIEFENLQKSAERTLQRALYAGSFHAKNEVEITSALVNRRQGAQIRYKRAHDNAIHMAFLAKRAIELRLGVRLEDMTEALPLVDAPSTWASSVCTRTGVDYTKLRTNHPDAPQDYADAFIGDYVTQLENLVESYRLEYGFHEGRDVAVVSLRDDVMNVRAPCEIDSENLLTNAGQLDRLQAIEVDEPGGWRVSGCREDTEGVQLPDCVMPNAFHAEETEALPREVATLAYDIEFGEDGTFCSGSDPCGFQEGVELAQTLELRPGRYRFSWYEWVPEGEGPGTRDLWVVRDSSGALATEVAGAFDDLGTSLWSRPFVEFDVESKTLVTVGFRQHEEEVASIRVAAPMLEVVGPSADEVPGIFMNTQAGSVSVLPACEDTSGEYFRSPARWDHQCMRLCKDGFSAECDSAASELYCYRQAKFTINQRDIESGKMFKSAGFARGNFNYRIDSVALNFVGSGTRDCSSVDAPSSCYGGGFVPYSLVHRGPYFVRNHMGQDFKAELFTGNIEHARGLATERYVTNPLSSADRELLSDYLRRELRGRPLDGNFLIRIWDEPGVDFDAIQDVQIVLNYRYWTRFD